MTYSPFRHAGSILLKRSPIQLTVFLTRRCNARCSFCFYLSGPGSAAEEPELSLEEIERVSASMGKLLWLAFSGGEIFLRDDLGEITKVFYERNKPAVILLPTNGLLPELIRERTEGILGRCGKSTVAVKLSLDGPEEVHDSLRGVRGAFKKSIETYRLLAELLGRYRNFELGVNTVFCSANQDRMDETIELVRGLRGIRSHTVSLIRGRVSDPGLKEIDAGKYLRTIGRMETDLREGAAEIYRFRGARLKAAQDILQRQLIYRTVIEKRRLVSCYAGRLNLVLTETGDVYPCEAFEKKMGNVREADCDMKRLLRTDQARTVARSVQGSSCFCTHECYFMTNILFNPSLYPGLLGKYLQI